MLSWSRYTPCHHTLPSNPSAQDGQKCPRFKRQLGKYPCVVPSEAFFVSTSEQLSVKHHGRGLWKGLFITSGTKTKERKRKWKPVLDTKWFQAYSRPDIFNMSLNTVSVCNRSVNSTLSFCFSPSDQRLCLME